MDAATAPYVSDLLARIETQRRLLVRLRRPDTPLFLSLSMMHLECVEHLRGLLPWLRDPDEDPTSVVSVLFTA